MNKIKSCPWCPEKEPTASAIETGTGCWVSCGKCGACGPFTVCKQDAIAAWNTRATAAPVVVGDDIRMIRQLVWRIKNDGALLKMTDLEADCTNALPALERVLTAALAGDAPTA